MEELLLQLIYFIPLFTSSSFILIGLESVSFNYTLYSTLCLSLVIFLRYCGEIAYIFLLNWKAYRLKLPQLYLYLGLDALLILILLCYAKSRLRDKPQKSCDDDEDKVKGEEKTSGWRPAADAKQVYEEGTTTIHNDLGEASSSSANTAKNVNVDGDNNKNNWSPVEGLHHPISPVDEDRRKKPLPPLPRDEIDDLSLPPSMPIATISELDNRQDI